MEKTGSEAPRRIGWRDEAAPLAPLELSVVMPCLNEALTVGACVESAFDGLRCHNVMGEVVVADNGSHDGSVQIAIRGGARVVHAAARGYGNALQAGIAAAQGDFVVMGDADGSYDFRALGPFLERLRDGHDVVLGNRFAGGIDAGAMPRLHRWVGNPALSGLGRLLFRAPVGDFHCGLRAFSRAAYDRMGLQAPGMEFASEMVAMGCLLGMRLTEVPVRLHKDGRRGPSHLRPWRDGCRHLRLLVHLRMRVAKSAAGEAAPSTTSSGRCKVSSYAPRRQESRGRA